MLRLLSYSEAATALDCEARWDFRYGGHLAGTALSPRRVTPHLSAGRAWGVAVAEWHGHPLGGLTAALQKIDESLQADADRQADLGIYDPETHAELRERLRLILLHYIDECGREPLMIGQPEREFVVPIPSRTGLRRSTRYRLVAYVDGIAEIDGRTWIVEFKLRSRLKSARLITMSRQIRWYAWAYWQETGDKPAGVLVDERLNQPPKPPRLVAGRSKVVPAGGTMAVHLPSGRVVEVSDGQVPSHAKDQLCTVADYEALCEACGVTPSVETAETLRQRRWQQRVPVQFRDDELDEVGRELVAVAHRINELDSGVYLPLRNTKETNCNGCEYRDICDAPDPDLVDALFVRVEPKRLRDPQPQEASN